MNTQNQSKISEFKPIGGEIGKIKEELGITEAGTEPSSTTESLPKEKKASKPDNTKEIKALVKECANKVKNLFGIETPSEALKAIADELGAINPQILLNSEVLLKSIGFLDFSFRTPKQLNLDDFIITPEKINTLKNKGLIVYTESKVAEIIEEYSSGLVELLKKKIDYLERKVEQEKLKNKYIPTIRGQQALSYLNKTVSELMTMNMSLTEQVDIKDRIIRRLEEKMERHNLLKNEIAGDAETNEIPTQETVGA